MTQPLAGKVALITGATRGIGQAAALSFAAAGAHIVAVGRTQGALEELDDRIGAAGGSASLVPLDLAEFDKIDALAGVVAQRYGRLDILVGNAAMLGSIGPMGHQSQAEFDRVFAVNVTANWRLVRAFDPLLRRAAGARVVFATCAVGHEPTAYWSAYAMSKAALEMMARSWAAELERTGIEVALVDPGPVRTGLRRKAFPGEDPATLAAPEAAAGLYLRHVLG